MKPAEILSGDADIPTKVMQEEDRNGLVLRNFASEAIMAWAKKFCALGGGLRKMWVSVQDIALSDGF